ncbi:MAG TPA: LysM peptidoglycan-binding domain-containing protein [Bacillota bacterium]|nr:LysM peptidoglycan-binding domain-containing protein [Bacillota bacterium]
MSINCPPGTFPYIIQTGETLGTLAGRYNTSVVKIVAANPGIDPNSLTVGQAICMPAISPPNSCPCGSRIYLVQAGESLYSIAQKFNTPFSVLYSANTGLDPANLQIGQAICLPPIPACPLQSVPYAIHDGETYATISYYTGITIDELIAANPGINPNNLQAGQVICLPYGMVSNP